MRSGVFMSPGIYLDDFEITENTESLHAIIGRALIIATRFDNLCDHTFKFMKLKSSLVVCMDDEFDTYVEKLFSKFSTLNNNINAIPVEQDIKDILHDARKARNDIAHSLTVGLTGCLDSDSLETSLIENISSLINRVSAGDYLISMILSILNKEPLLQCSESAYKKQIVEWVVEK
jgi:hypothetical protein